MRSLQLAPGTNPPPSPWAAPVLRSLHLSSVCACVNAIHSAFRGCGAGGAHGPGDSEWKTERGGSAVKRTIGWPFTGGYGVSLITQRPHLLIYSNYLPTRWAPCQRRGVNTADQIHLKIKVPTHSTTPTWAFYGGLTALQACVSVEERASVFILSCEHHAMWNRARGKH